MPLFDSILDNKVLGREYKRGFAQGFQEAREEARRQGMLNLLRRQIEKHFGPIPAWAEERLASRSTMELEDLCVNIFDTLTINDLLK